MLQDKRRVEAYDIAVKKLCKGKIVADVGAGTGVLSIIAAEGEATKVYAIE
jgi:predicted RNA methylase